MIGTFRLLLSQVDQISRIVQIKSANEACRCASVGRLDELPLPPWGAYGASQATSFAPKRQKVVSELRSGTVESQNPGKQPAFCWLAPLDGPC